MIPILKHFDGIPTPEPNGAFIVYKFPSLTSEVEPGLDPFEKLAQFPYPFKLEKFRIFSKCGKDMMNKIIALGAFNLVLIFIFTLIVLNVDLNYVPSTSPPNSHKYRAKNIQAEEALQLLISFVNLISVYIIFLNNFILGLSLGLYFIWSWIFRLPLAS